MEENNIFVLPKKESFKAKLNDDNGNNSISLDTFLNLAKEHLGPSVEYEKACISYYEQRRNIAETYGFKYLTILLSINGSESDTFHIQIYNDMAERLEKLYKEHSQSENFNNGEFWNILKIEDEDLSDVILEAINEELSLYILTNRNPLLLHEGQEPDDVFPLRYLHFVYLDGNYKPTTREKAQWSQIFLENQFDCDFSITFDNIETEIDPEATPEDLPF